MNAPRESYLKQVNATNQTKNVEQMGANESSIEIIVESAPLKRSGRPLSGYPLSSTRVEQLKDSSHMESYSSSKKSIAIGSRSLSAGNYKTNDKKSNDYRNRSQSLGVPKGILKNTSSCGVEKRSAEAKVEDGNFVDSAEKMEYNSTSPQKRVSYSDDAIEHSDNDHGEKHGVASDLQEKVSLFDAEVFEKLTQSLQTKEELVVELTKCTGLYKKELEKLRNNLDAVSKENNVLTAELREAISREAKLKELEGTKSIECSRLKQEVRILEEKVELLKQLYHEGKSGVREGMQDHPVPLASSSELEVREALSKKEKRLEEASAQLNALSLELEAKKSAIEARDKRLADQSQMISHLQLQIDECNSEKSQDANTLRSHIAQLQGLLNAKNGELDAKEIQYQKDLSSLREELDSLGNQFEENTKQSNLNQQNLKTTIEHLEREKLELKSENESLQARWKAELSTHRAMLSQVRYEVLAELAQERARAASTVAEVLLSDEIGSDKRENAMAANVSPPSLENRSLPESQYQLVREKEIILAEYEKLRRLFFELDGDKKRLEISYLDITKESTRMQIESQRLVHRNAELTLQLRHSHQQLERAERRVEVLEDAAEQWRQIASQKELADVAEKEVSIKAAYENETRVMENRYKELRDELASFIGLWKEHKLAEEVEKSEKNKIANEKEQESKKASEKAEADHLTYSDLITELETFCTSSTNRLEAALLDSQKRCIDLENQVIQAQQERDDLIEQIQQMRVTSRNDMLDQQKIAASVSKLHVKKNSELQDIVKNQQNEIGSLKQTLKEALNERTNANHLLDVNQAELSHTKLALAELGKRRDELSSKLLESREELHARLHNEQIIVEENEKLKSDNSKSLSLLAEKNAKINQLHHQIKQFEDAMASLQKLLKELVEVAISNSGSKINGERKESRFKLVSNLPKDSITPNLEDGDVVAGECATDDTADTGTSANAVAALDLPTLIQAGQSESARTDDSMERVNSAPHILSTEDIMVGPFPEWNNEETPSQKESHSHKSKPFSSNGEKSYKGASHHSVRPLMRDIHVLVATLAKCIQSVQQELSARKVSTRTLLEERKRSSLRFQGEQAKLRKEIDDLEKKHKASLSRLESELEQRASKAMKDAIEAVITEGERKYQSKLDEMHMQTQKMWEAALLQYRSLLKESILDSWMKDVVEFHGIIKHIAQRVSKVVVETQKQNITDQNSVQQTESLANPVSFDPNSLSLLLSSLIAQQKKASSGDTHADSSSFVENGQNWLNISAPLSPEIRQECDSIVASICGFDGGWDEFIRWAESTEKACKSSKKTDLDATIDAQGNELKLENGKETGSAITPPIDKMLDELNSLVDSIVMIIEEDLSVYRNELERHVEDNLLNSSWSKVFSHGFAGKGPDYDKEVCASYSSILSDKFHKTDTSKVEDQYPKPTIFKSEGKQSLQSISRRPNYCKNNSNNAESMTKSSQNSLSVSTGSKMGGSSLSRWKQTLRAHGNVNLN